MIPAKTVSASIVLFKNDPEELKTLIDLVLRSADSIRLYLIDNSPTEVLRSQIPVSDRVEYEFNPANTGYIAHNKAMRRSLDSGFQYHVVLNPDVFFDPDIFTKIVDFMDQNIDIGLLLPKIFFPDGRLQYSCKLLPTPVDFFLRLFLPRRWTSRRMDRFELRLSGYAHLMDAPYMSGCFMFLRNSVLADVGLFDERFFMYAEDIDLSRRIHEHSRSVLYPDVSIVHRHAAESYRNFRLFRIHLKNVFQYFNKYGWFFDRDRRRINHETLAQFDKVRI